MARVVIEHGKDALLRAFGVVDTTADIFAATIGDSTFDGKFRRTSKGALVGADLSTPLGAHLCASTITVRGERTVDRLGKLLRINREFTSGDPTFDEAVYLEADVPDRTLEPIFASPEVRRRLLDLLRGGVFDALKITADDCLVFSIPRSQLTRAADITSGLGTSSALRAALATAQQEALAARQTGGYRDTGQSAVEDVTTLRLPNRAGQTARLLFLWGAVLAVVAFHGGTPHALDWSSLQASLLGILVAAHHLVIVARLRGRSDSLRQVAAFSFVALPLLIVVLSRLVERIDIVFDHGPRQTVDGTFVPVHDQKGDGWHWEAQLLGTQATLDLPSFDASREKREGKPAVFTVGHGALGTPWIESCVLR